MDEIRFLAFPPKGRQRSFIPVLVDIVSVLFAVFDTGSATHGGKGRIDLLTARKASARRRDTENLAWRNNATTESLDESREEEEACWTKNAARWL
eukprot:scaffold1046_cov172-Amphora_coffeaeformis.AAC.4